MSQDESTLEDKLIRSGRTRWLDIGSGGKLDRGFDLMDLFPVELVKPSDGNRYFRLDIVEAPEEELRKLGEYDLVRMQHVLEHLTFEAGKRALVNCATLLAPGGVLLLTVPDLAVHVQRYLDESYLDDEGYVQYAMSRIPREAPASAYFSVFAHSLTVEPHKWCYDYPGLAFQVSRTGRFESLARLDADDPLASSPFTHNRPAEDVCLIAYKTKGSASKQ